MFARRLLKIFARTAAVALSIASAARGDWLPQPLPAPQEVAAALEACPAVVRERAGVYLLTASGYQLHRPSSNGFHAIVERSQEGAFEPQCLDAEGSATLLQRILLQGALRMNGAAREEIEREVGRAWEEGRLRAPRRPGINYMLSNRNRVPIGPDRVIAYGAHVMFYVPYLRDEDLGGDATGSGSPVFVVNGGAASAYAIVPVASDEPGPTHPQ